MLWEIEKKNVDQNVFIFKISRHSDNSLSVILFVLPLIVLLIKDYMTMPFNYSVSCNRGFIYIGM
jgi:hypothetical protein